jgi:hypothetical protein
MKLLLRMRNIRIHFNNILFIALLILGVNCGEDKQEVVLDSLAMNFMAEASGQALVYSTEKYVTKAGNDISINRIKLYISNVHLINSTNNSSFVEPDSYHLVSLNSDNTLETFTINNIPDGLKFDQIKFAVGVDTDKNFSLDNIGDLDPANDMAWNWDTGYKFLLIEGTYFPTGASENKGLIIHIGHDKNYREMTLSLNKLVSINGTANVDVTLDALAPLNGPNVIDLTDNSSFKGQAASDLIADNYSANLVKSYTTNLE